MRRTTKRIVDALDRVANYVGLPIDSGNLIFRKTNSFLFGVDLRGEPRHGPHRGSALSWSIHVGWHTISKISESSVSTNHTTPESLYASVAKDVAQQEDEAIEEYFNRTRGGVS